MRAYTEDGILFNSSFLNNLTVNEAIKKIIKVIKKKKLGKKKITYSDLKTGEFQDKDTGVVLFL